MKRIFLISALLCASLFSMSSHSAGGRIDYDLDDDGLIEINDLLDLNEIRNNLNGATLYGSSEGCPVSGCKGFELTADLDFDSNRDNKINAEDHGGLFWNGGKGWYPIGRYYEEGPFTAIFNGNGHQIRNLYIKRPDDYHVGLFSYAQNSVFEDLIITGPLSIIEGGTTVGALVGNTKGSKFRRIYIGAHLRGGYTVGQLMGYGYHGTHIEDVVVSGSVIADGNHAGVVGYSSGLAGGNIDKTNSVKRAISTAAISGAGRTGGIVSILYNTDIANSYWALDASGQATSAAQSEADRYVGLNLATLQCAVAENTDFNSGCVSNDGSAEGLAGPVVLYNQWDPATWDFGNANQLAGLKFNGAVARDSDGDGIIDGEDKWPNNPAAAIDSDNDGHPDIWPLGCDQTCINNSGLTLDGLPQFAGAWLDEDHDGLADALNETCVENCNVPAEFIDSFLNDYDNDGIVDAIDDNDDGLNGSDVDADSDGLVDISTVAHLDAMRYQLQGAGLKTTENAEIDSSGCPFVLHEGIYQRRCHGYELINDLNFDSNGDGVVDSNDYAGLYWHENEEGIGQGWLPIASEENPFEALFDGNGYQIKNLFINREASDNAALFAVVKNTRIENLVLSGAGTAVRGRVNVAVVAGAASDSSFNKLSVSGNVQAEKYAGLVIGNAMFNTHIKNISLAGSVASNSYAGGLVGRIESKSSSSRNTMDSILSTVAVSASSSVLPIYGYSLYLDMTNVYWAKDIVETTNSFFSNQRIHYLGLNLAVLQCAIAENSDYTSGCVSEDGSAEGFSKPVILFNQWDPEVWDFGTSTQLPGLKFSHAVVRDNDGDGVTDAEDAWPDDRAVAIDRDDDGHPDKWNISCDEQCRINSGFQLDGFPQLAGAWKDDDHDGLVDEKNTACTINCDVPDALLDNNLSDYDNDGIVDAIDEDDDGINGTDADADSDGLIDIASLAQLNAMRYELKGAGLKMNADGNTDSSGCPFIIYRGTYQRRCHGYELIQDLDFDSNSDGIVNGDDHNGLYWYENDIGEGMGWRPIAMESLYSYFSATFNGNGHTIKNLYINRSGNSDVGLFSKTSDAKIENLIIAGPATFIKGGYAVAALVGESTRSQFNKISVFARLRARGSSGLVVGDAQRSTKIQKVIASGSIEQADENGLSDAGGIVGRSLFEENVVQQSISTVKISSTGDIGGIVGFDNKNQITSSYWAKDYSGIERSLGSSVEDSYVGLNLDTLQCPLAENAGFESGCVSNDGSSEGLTGPIIVYNQWDSADWDFGTADQLPALKFGNDIYRDSDLDGALDEDDAFVDNPAASLDSDKDSMPDIWNPICEAPECQQSSGLEADPSPNDIDNDGVPDLIDTDNSRDNGKPSLLTIPTDISELVNSADAIAFEADRDYIDQLYSQLSAEDFVDAAEVLTFKAFVAGQEMVRNAEGGFNFDSGLIVIDWVAIDTSGNESDALQQKLFIYPQVRFSSPDSISGEFNNAEIVLALSGDAPEYPVIIELQVDTDSSTAMQPDVAESFDLTAKHQLVINAGDDPESLNREATFIIPVADGGESEVDETLLLNIVTVKDDSQVYAEGAIDAEHSSHELTITETNLPPIIELVVKQAGAETNEVIQDGGEVTITALVTDPNGKDSHSFVWDVNSLGFNATLESEFVFDPAQVAAGNYLVSVVATDNGINPLSVEREVVLSVVAGAVVEPGPDPGEAPDNGSGGGGSSGGGSSGGGAMHWWLLMAMMLLIYRRQYRV